ncbi:hypothetical protein BDN70DRAFT_138353 [Pholiota conissans]|uniref:Uncharacterized protein n=1 Tax=Pholiota conissans TaxID=109636 RepID=A0A9P5YYE3_9AGAR|nr:hypothetical protein BDN70DRAFT_138353 [Pholiota conissans]
MTSLEISEHINACDGVCFYVWYVRTYLPDSISTPLQLPIRVGLPACLRSQILTWFYFIDNGPFLIAAPGLLCDDRPYSLQVITQVIVTQTYCYIYAFMAPVEEPSLFFFAVRVYDYV